MSLYCTTCRSSVEEGLNQCYNCNTGFVSQLACSTCNSLVPRGLAYCSSPRCQSSSSLSGSLVSSPAAHSPSLDLSRLPVPPLSGLAERLRGLQTVPETYQAGSHGVQSEVTVPACNVASIQHEVQLIAALEAYAAEANQRTGLSDLGRRNIRACRLLAVDLREEVELTVGPRGEWSLP